MVEDGVTGVDGGHGGAAKGVKYIIFHTPKMKSFVRAAILSKKDYLPMESH